MSSHAVEAQRPSGEADRELASLVEAFEQLGDEGKELARSLGSLCRHGKPIAWTKQMASTAGKRAAQALAGFIVELVVNDRDIAESNLAIVAVRESIRIKCKWHEDSMASAAAKLDEHLSLRDEMRGMLQRLLRDAQGAGDIVSYRMLSESLSALNRVSPDEWRRIFREEYEAEIGARVEGWGFGSSEN